MARPVFREIGLSADFPPSRTPIRRVRSQRETAGPQLALDLAPHSRHFRCRERRGIAHGKRHGLARSERRGDPAGQLGDRILRGNRQADENQNQAQHEPSSYIADPGHCKHNPDRQARGIQRHGERTAGYNPDSHQE